jgi:hypothetical protein
LWSAKGGSGCTVVSAAVGLLSASQRETLLVDLGGDLDAVLGNVEPGLGMGSAGHHGCSDSGLWAEPEPGSTPVENAVVAPGRSAGVVGWLVAPNPPPDALARLERPVVPGLSLLPLGPALGAELEAEMAGDELSGERLEILARLLATDQRRVVVDLGRGLAGQHRWLAPFLDLARYSALVTRPCYLALSRAARQRRPDGVIVLNELGRALSSADISATLGVPVVATMPWDPAVARAVDAGLLARRLPRTLGRLRVLTDGALSQW